jgi:hypothetical protein
MWLLAVLLLLWAAPTWGNTYYVDQNGAGGTCASGNPGTQSQPKCTIAEGIALLSGGDTLYIRAGTYNESINSQNSNPLPSGSSWATATIIAGYPGETVTLTGGQGIQVIIYGPGVRVQYVIFRNFQIRSGTYGLQAQGCGYFGDGTVDMSCGPHFIRWQDIDVANTGCSSGVANSYGVSDLEYINVTVHDGGCDQLDHGFYVLGPRGLYDNIHVYNMTGYGFQMYDSLCPSPDGGITRNCGADTIIRNSRIHDNGAVGQGGVTLSHGSNIQFYNNLVYNNNLGGVGVAYGAMTNTQIYNNVFYGNPQGAGLDISAASINTLVKNNIFLNNQGTVSGALGTGTVFATNLCGSSGTGCTLVANPLFTNAAGAVFTVAAASPARNAGTTLTTFNTDKNGAARNQGGAWDIGAYEYDEGGMVGPPPTGNPIYVAATGGTPTTDCIAAENQATPIRTLTGGLACMGTVPGKILYIKAGTYAECLDTGTQPIKGGNGPSYADATVIATYANDLVTIQPTACPQGGVVFFRNGAADSYIVVRGSAANRLVFDGSALANNVVLWPSAHHVRFEYVEVKNTFNFEAFYGLNTANIELVDSLVHSAVTSGIALDGTAANWLIERTTVYSNGGVGINHKSGTITGLTIKESAVRDNTGNGLSLGTSTGVAMRNSLIYDNGGIGARLLTGSTGTKLYNNNFYSNTGNGVQCDIGASGVELTNNIVFGNATNIVNSCSATLTTNYTSDPLFVAPPGNQALQDGSGAINAGTTLASVTIDVAGTLRPQGTNYDIGAYERTQAAMPGVNVTVSPCDQPQAMLFF